VLIGTAQTKVKPNPWIVRYVQRYWLWHAPPKATISNSKRRAYPHHPIVSAAR
jgi:hypothetical protein